MKNTSPPPELHPGLASCILYILCTALVMVGPDLRADVPAPQITQFHASSNSSVSLSWSAAPDVSYTVLTSSNLNGTWLPIDSIVAASNTVTWQANGQSGPARFYKLATEAISIQN